MWVWAGLLAGWFGSEVQRQPTDFFPGGRATLMMALLMQAGSADFINGDSIELTTFFDQAVDIHHIFPRSHCEEQGHPRQKWNSVINKAPITARTNRILGGKAPTRYLASIERNHGVEPTRLDEILCTHLIQSSLLRTDDFDAFTRDRACHSTWSRGRWARQSSAVMPKTS